MNTNGEQAEGPPAYDQNARAAYSPNAEQQAQVVVVQQPPHQQVVQQPQTVGAPQQGIFLI